MDFQPAKMHLSGRCSCCGDMSFCLSPEAYKLLKDDRTLDDAVFGDLKRHGKLVIAGYNNFGQPTCICTECYFEFVELRALSQGGFSKFSKDDLTRLQNDLTNDFVGAPETCDERASSHRLMLILRIRGDSHRKPLLRNLIADDLRLPPDQIFPRRLEGCSADMRTAKDAAFSRMASGLARLRLVSSLTSMTAKAIYLLLIVLAAFLLFRRSAPN